MIEILAQVTPAEAAAGTGGWTIEIGVVLAGVLTVLITTTAQLILAVINHKTSKSNKVAIEAIAEKTDIMKRTGENTEAMVSGKEGS